MASRNKTIGRKAEKKFVAWFTRIFGLIPLIRDKSGSNLSTAEVARAEEVSQLLDNEGVDIWFGENTGFRGLNIQVKSTLVTGKKSKTIDIEPLYHMPDTGINLLFTEVKYRPGKKNMIQYGDIVSMKLEDFAEILLVYQKYRGNDNNDADS